MRRFLMIMYTLFLGGLLLSSSGCNKKNDAVPDFPQLMGQWEGTTSQGSSIRVNINSEDGVLVVSLYDLNVFVPGGHQQYYWYIATGIVSLTGVQFSVPLGSGSSGPAFLDGMFSLNNMTLDGNFAVYATGNPVDKITGTYSCTKTN